MDQNSLKKEVINQPQYLARTPAHYLEMLDPEIRLSFTPPQLESVEWLLDTAIPKPAPKLVDLRFGVDLLVSRFYIVLFVGKDRRQKSRSYLPEPMVRLGNAIAAIVLLVSLNLLISLFIVLLAYLVKSAIGIDLVPNGHLADQLQKLD